MSKCLFNFQNGSYRFQFVYDLICNFLPFEKILQYLLSIIIFFYNFAFGMSAISGFDMGKEDPFA